MDNLTIFFDASHFSFFNIYPPKTKKPYFFVIKKSLTFLKNQLNEYLYLKYEEPSIVSLTHLLNSEGKAEDYKLGLTLVNVEEERKLKSQSPYREGLDGKKYVANPDIKLNLFLLFTANHSNYEDGLEALSSVIQFFENNHVFTPEQYPSMEAPLERLILDLYTMSFEQQNNLWGSLSARYLPSVLYRMRLIAFNPESLEQEMPTTGQLNANLGGAS